MKKLLSVFLSVLLVVQLVVPVWAAETAAETDLSAPETSVETAADEAPEGTLSATDVDPGELSDAARLLTDGGSTSPMTGKMRAAAAMDNGYYTNLDEAAVQLRTQMVARKRYFTLPVRVSKTTVANKDELDAVALALVAVAAAHTGVPNEGDYLLWGIEDMDYSGTYSETSKYYYLDITYQIDFYTSQSMESSVAIDIDEIMADFNFSASISDYCRVLAIYDYICSRVEYGGDNPGSTSDGNKYTAYGALGGKAHALGYATLLYRMLLEAGVDSRIIAGYDAETGVEHFWNIVQLDGVYYNLDSMLDAGYLEYWYFLRGSDNFTDHIRESSVYDSADFHTLYPMAKDDYVPKAPVVIASGSCGENAVYTIYSDGYMEITGSGPMTNWTSADAVPWKNYRGYVRYVSVADGITTVGSYAFADCQYMIFTDLPDSISEIGTCAFYQARMTAFVVPSGLKKVGESAFYVVPATKALIIQDLAAWMDMDIEGVYANPGYGVDKWYLGDEELTELVIPEGTTEIKDYAFYGADGITSVHVPDSVTRIGKQAFSNASALTTVTGCNKVSEIGFYAFEYTALTEITLNGITKLNEGVFCNCQQLKKVTLGPGLTTVADNAFGGSSNIEEVHISDLAAWCKIDFQYNDPGYIIRVIACNPLYYAENFYCNGERISELVIPDGVTEIKPYAFAGYGGLLSVTVPESVTVIGNDVFFECDNLKTVWFQGDAPEFRGDSFASTWPTIYYFADNTTWTEEVMQTQSNTVTWVAICAGPHDEVVDAAVAPTCTETGLTEGKHCTVCGMITVLQKEVPMKDHSYVDGVCTVCGAKDPNYVAELTGVTRIFGADRYETAFKTAEVLKQQLGVEKFNNIVVACGDNFADALGGSYLAAKKGAPILLVKSSKIDAVKSYIKANLNPGGTVYLLGGTAAIPAAMDTGLDGFTVRRLAGATRYDTNLLILEEAGVTNEDILICTGKSFADSLSAAAAGRPLLLVKDSLNDSQKAFLQSHAANKKYILGGTAAVSTSVENQAKAYGTVKRIGGSTRYETSVLIAQEFFPDATQAALAYAQNFPDGLSGGALAYAMKAPLVLTASGKEAAAAAYAKEQCIGSGVIFGGSGLISDKAVRTIFQMKSSDVIKIG